MVLNNLNRTETYQNVGTPLFTFSWWDYVLFAAMMGVSGVIGIFYGCFGNKQNSTQEYLLGGRSMHIFPVAMSLVASYTSGMSVLGLPAEIYRYGAMHIWSMISLTLCTSASIYVYMPVFLNLKLITVYQYLDMRFGKSVKIIASFTYIFHLLIYNPVVIFLPCLAFNQATGYNITVLAPATVLFCVFYTAIGGLKTVVWTDTFQTISIVLGTIVVFCMGFYHSGSVKSVFQIASKGDRLNIFNFDLDPTTRDTFWTHILGCASMWMIDVAISQTTLQRLSAVSTFGKAKRVMLLYCVVTIILRILSILVGIAMYARYADCDPYHSGKVAHVDQVVPYYVIDVAGSILGFPGLFIAGVFAAGLSTLSTNLLNLSTTIYTDFLSSFISPSVSEKTISNILKLIVVIVGIIDCGLVFLVSNFGSVLQFGISLIGVTYGTLFGLFALGMVFPMANKQGAICGGIFGLVFSASMVFGTLWYKYQGLLPDNPKPFSTGGCNMTSPFLRESRHISEEETPPIFFRLSFWYFPFYGCLVVLAVGLLVSFVTRKSNPKVRHELISPMFQFMLTEKQLEKEETYQSTHNDISMKLISHKTEDNIE